MPQRAFFDTPGAPGSLAVMESSPDLTPPASVPPSPAGDLIDARFVLPQGAPDSQRRAFLTALGYATESTLELPPGVEAEVAFSLASVPRADMLRQLEFLRTTLPDLVLEQHPAGSLAIDDREPDDGGDEWDGQDDGTRLTEPARRSAWRDANGVAE